MLWNVVVVIETPSIDLTFTVLCRAASPLAMCSSFSAVHFYILPHQYRARLRFGNEVSDLSNTNDRAPLPELGAHVF